MPDEGRLSYDSMSDPGKYVVRTINHYKAQDYVFYISNDLPTISANADDTAKQLKITVTPSTDWDVYVTNITITYSAETKTGKN